MRLNTVNFGVLLLIAVQIHYSAGNLHQLINDSAELENKYDANNIDSELDAKASFRNPCTVLPCGPNAMCFANGEEYTCKCLPEMLNRPPNCHAECSIDLHCPDEMLCINYRCRDPCAVGICGTEADCRVINHTPLCECPENFSGDPYIECISNGMMNTDQMNYFMACDPNPCTGVENAMCIEQNGMGTCVCLPNYYGDPKKPDGCMPKCTEHADCPSNMTCIRNECHDACENFCPENADCHITANHIVCTCKAGFTGDANRNCTKIEQTSMEVMNACRMSPCGENSMCHSMKGMASCSCLPGFSGLPPNCVPDNVCKDSDECDMNKTCIEGKCMNPCGMDICGVNAFCHVANRSPMCTCVTGYTGNPFEGCKPLPPKSFFHPCLMAPCGPHADCIVDEQNSDYTCHCLPNFIGSPPNCRPECESNTDCPAHMSCLGQFQNRACHPMPLPMLNASIEFIAWFRTETTMVIMWRSDDPINSTFTEYKVIIQPADIEPNVQYLERECGPTKFVEVTFSGLIPGRNYNISVQTKLGDRISMPVTVSYHTVPMRPNSLTLDGNSLTTNRFRIMWLSPQNFTEFDEYEVMIQSEYGSLEYVQLERVKRRNDNYLNEFTTETSLQPGQTYQVTVKTVSGIAKSWPETIHVTTRPLPVKDLKSSVDIESGRVMIWWQPNERSHQNGYKISYMTVGRGHGPPAAAMMNRLSMTTNQTAYIFESLSPIRNYSMSVQALSNNVPSIESTIYVLTPPSVEWYF